ncbi:hypothetical protein [Paractinoplanes rishiriensis]|uniref:Uncharacterized protein n=1 Tax=Paractinoplanes rishiriensis TaxID=1050105 RepID=A0A919K3E5_9ACTN|nr:hypothetical protein [Actinoplanes rishiriensis]GIF00172.1 hypothetical protein Ari01nite_76360 [Actinoplanes rishiriensis]
MPDTDIRRMLDDYISDEPPMSFGLADVRAAGRRARRRRRAAALSGAGAVVAMVAAGAGMMGVRPDDGTRPAPHRLAGAFWAELDPRPFCTAALRIAPTQAPTTVTNEKNGYPVRIPAEPAEHAAARLSCYLAGAVPPLLPGADYYRSESTPAGTVPLEAYPAETTPPAISASAVVSDERGVGEIAFGMWARASTEAENVANCDGPPCTVRRGPNGEAIIVLDVRQDSGVRLVNITVFRGDTMAFASASNALPAPPAPTGQAGSAGDRRLGRDDLALSVDQLIDLLMAPAFTLFPPD